MSGFMSVCSMPVPCHFYCLSSEVQLEIWMVSPPAVLLLFRIISAILIFLCVCFNMKMKVVLSRSVKNCVETLMRTALTLYIAFGSVPVLCINSTDP